jgi:lipoyl(octanoyl) transferase
MKFLSLTGLVSYDRARELQLALLDRRASHLPGEGEDTVLFLEHESVITQGRGLQFTGAPRPRHMPVPLVLPPGMAFAESERGGDLTYHGPGQLVVYPIVKLDGLGWGPRHDIAAFLRSLEKIFADVLSRELAARGLVAEARENAAGVWVGERKLASIGIAIRKWITYHGIAINVVNDLSAFRLISPCGFAPEVMTTLSELIPGFARENWRADLEQNLATRIARGSATIESLSVAEAFSRA